MEEHKNKPSDAEVALDEFIGKNSWMWGLDMTYTKEFIMEYKNELIELIKRL